MSELASRLPLARGRSDRDATARGTITPKSDPRALALTIQGDRALAKKGDLDLQLAASLPVLERWLYLGVLPSPRKNPDGRLDEAGTPVFAVEAQAPLSETISLRAATALEPTDLALFATAVALHRFHESHRFHPTSGERLRPAEGGWVLQDPSGHSVFPRTDPAVITLVTDGEDRVLLGANAAWQPQRFSAFAGFVEPGESLEAAAAREVMEEANAAIVNLRYLGSQPWPFPASLMIGFIGELDPAQDPATVRGDGEEINEVRWFTRAELAASAHLLPSRVSIARAMIEHWYGGPIEDAPRER